MLANLLDHSLFATLRGLRGNVRGVVFTEPLWGIPYNLYAPYVSVYMLALGLTDSQIGLITSVGLTFQIVWTLLSGAITDKFGRKRTTYITDIIAWSVPTLIWAVAQDFNYFLAAAIVSSTWRITHNSWLCLLVEDTEPKLLVDVYSLIYISGLLAAFFSPIASLLIATYSLVPTMRGLYFLAFLMMTLKFVVMNNMVHETEQGLERMAATRHQSIFQIVGDSTGVLRRLLRTPATMVTAGLLVVVGIGNTINMTFWSVLVTQKLGIDAAYLAYFYVVRSLTMLGFYFLVMPRLREMDARKPMVLGFAGVILSWAWMIVIQPQSVWMVIPAVVVEACSFPLISTMLDKLVATTVEAGERARIMAILYTLNVLFVSPFGWIAGQLSEMDRTLPFVLTIAIFAIGGVLAFIASRRLPELVETPLDAAPGGD